nr:MULTISPECIES: tape measure protein [unclassified Acinetobacter]
MGWYSSNLSEDPVNSEKLGLNQEKVAKITESISKSISNSGSSAQAASAALYQLGQAFDKSSLNGDEFVSMSENAGYLMEVFAKGLGVTRAELKEMSSAGELTTDKMIQAISKMSESIEEDFGKTNFTIGQSITQFSNAATQFIGGAGESSGAAVMLSSSIKTLADNMNLIANVAVLGGVTMLTKAILTQTVSIHAATTSSIARRASMLGELQAVAQATTAEVSRTGAIAQLRAMQLADAQATAARLTGMQRLTYVQTTLLPLERASTVAVAAHTAAINTDTLAQNANNAARSRATRIFNAVGGTVGVLTIGVAALAAGYMYMQKRADEANKKLEEQAEVAKKAKEELLALNGLEKDDAIDKMTASFKHQNEALEQSSSTINMQLNAIEKLYKGNKEVIQVVQDARNGTIGMSEAVKRFNEIRIDKEVYNSFKKNAEIFNKNAEAAINSKEKLKLFRQEVVLAGRDAQTAKLGLDKGVQGLTGKAASIAQAIVNTEEGATKALAQGGMYGSLLAGVVRATGYASVGMIAGQTIASFATGGHVRGPGTSTSDSIPAMLSDYEFVTKASAVKKIGVANMEYMNRTGEMPFQKEYEELHKRIAGNQLPEPFIVPKYKDGGLVGSSRVQPDAYSQIYREREVVDKVKAVNVQPKITINTPPGTYAETRVDTDGAITIDVIRKEAEDAAKRSWDRLGNANSHESQQLSRNTNSNRRR